MGASSKKKVGKGRKATGGRRKGGAAQPLTLSVRGFKSLRDRVEVELRPLTLLSGRNSFYLINTVTIIVANLALSFALVTWLGTVGAAWARLGADIIGFACALLLSRFAFKVPFPPGPLALVVIASLAMALIEIGRAHV